ncbi:KGG domain-containing protein [Serratia sp. M24T3]|uniref:KGG domain-containing protein n=1 Tax=Serratia sp. M24T3 TaxID=932213 RepID=UPI00025BB417|nr:KGG domain-containing protein [Serratia sp. M24T3]EIC85354.1 hypothetical protein SPM24T3_07944 [Serratia sp. M24T3]
MADHRNGTGNASEDHDKSSENGKKGGNKHGKGNFADDRERASEAGKKGGKNSHGSH